MPNNITTKSFLDAYREKNSRLPDDDAVRINIASSRDRAFEYVQDAADRGVDVSFIKENMSGDEAYEAIRNQVGLSMQEKAPAYPSQSTSSYYDANEKAPDSVIYQYMGENPDEEYRNFMANARKERANEQYKKDLAAYEQRNKEFKASIPAVPNDMSILDNLEEGGSMSQEQKDDYAAEAAHLKQGISKEVYEDYVQRRDAFIDKYHPSENGYALSPDAPKLEGSQQYEYFENTKKKVQAELAERGVNISLDHPDMDILAARKILHDKKEAQQRLEKTKSNKKSYNAKYAPIADNNTRVVNGMVMVDGADRLTAAYNHFADKTIDLLEKEWIGDESFGGFMGAFWDALKDPNEICFGLPEMFSEGKMTELLKKQILYDNLNDKERETLQAYFDYVEAMLLRADSISKTARAGESAGMSMQFMGTMAVSGGIWSLASKGAGKLATKFFALRIMKAFKLKDLATAEARMARFFEKGVEWENVNKRIAGMESGAAKVAAKVGAELGDVGTSLAGTLWNGGGITLSSPGTYVKAYRDAIEHIDVDDYGKVVLKGPAYDNIFYASLAQIMGGESYWENTGEQSGGFMMKLLSKAGKWSGLAAMMQYIRNVKGIGAASGKIANTWDAIQDFVSVPKAFTDTFKMGGMIEESLEELFSATGTYLTKCVKGECSEKDLEEYLDFFDPENLEVLFMSFATIPVMGGIASTGNLGYTKGKLKSAKDMAYMYTQDFMTDNQIEAAMSAIDNMDAKDMTHGISRLVKDSNLSAREKTVLGQVLTNYGCAKISNDKWYNSEAAGEQVDDIRSGINERNERMGNMYNAALLKSAGVEVDDASMQDIKEYAEARGLNNYDLEAAIKGIDTEAGADTIRDIEQFRNEKQLAAQLQSQYAENCVEGTRSYQAVSKGAQNGHIVAYSSDGISATVSWDGENGSTVEQVPLSQLQFGESIENVDQFIADRISGQQAKYDQAESYRVGDIFIVQESYEGKQHGEEVEEKEAPHGIKQLKSFENGIFEFDDGTTLAEEQLVANPEAMTPMFEVGNERFKDDEGNIISVVNRQVHATDNQFGENQHGDSYWVNVISPEGQTTSKLMTSDELWTAMATSQYSDGYTYVNMLSEGMKKLVPADVINEAHNRAQRNAADKERGGKVDDLEAGEQITVADENSEDGGMSTLTYKGKEGDMLVFEDENGNKVLKNPVKDAREIQEGRNAQRERDAQQNTDDEGHQAEVRKTAESFTETYSEPLDAFESCLQTLNDAKSKAEKLAAEASKVVPIRNDRDKQAIKRKREAAQKAQQDVDFYNEVAHYIPTMTGHTFEEFADMLAEKSGKKTKGRKKTTETKGNKPENKGVTRKPAQTKAGERYQAAPKIEGRRGTMTLRNGQKVKGHYVLTTPDSLTPSHDPRNRFLKHPDFPVNDKGETINDRDYEVSKDNQGHVIRIGQKYDGQAIENVPVISSEGIVYSGNNRTMSGQLAADNNTDSEYIESLKENAEGYGLSAEDIDSMEHPRLVFELDEELPYDTNTMKLFNQNNEKPQDAAEKAVAISKRLTERNIIDIANILEGYSTLESIYNAKGEASDLMNYLLRKKIISEMDITGFMKGDGKLTDEGKKFVDTLLLGTLFDAKEVRLIMGMPDEKLRLMRAFKSIMQNYKLGNDFNLKNELNEAVRLLSDLKSGKLNMEEFLYQQRIDGKVGSDDYSSFALMIANAVKTNLDTLRDVVNSYNMEAENSASGMNDIFSQRIIPKEEIIDKVLRNLLDNNEYNSDIGNELRKRIQQKDGRTEQEQPAATKPTAGQGNAETKPSVPSVPAGDGKGKAQKGGTEKVESEQKPLRKGDCVEYEGKKWKVSRVIGGKASLTEINSKGKAGSIKENVPVSDLKQIEAPKNLAFSLGDTSTYNGMTSQAAHVADNARKLAETMGISAKVISDVSQIPASEQQAIDSIKKGLAVRAWVGTDGTMYIYGPQLSKEGVTAKEMEALLFHEGVAHIGVRKLMGAESGAFYQAVWNFMGQANRKEMLKYVFQTRTDVAEWNKAVSTPADKRTKEQTKLIFEVQNHAADEYVAHMAEKIGKKEAEKSELTKAFDEVCDWVRRKLGKLGFKFTGSLTREDIAKAIMASRRNITGQKFEGNTEERFSVNHYGEEKPYHNDKYPISDRQAIFREFNRNTYDKPGTDIYIIGDYAYSVDHYVSEGYLDGSKSNYIVGLGIRGRIKITKLPKAKYNEFINAYKNNDVHDRRSYNNWLKEHGADTTSNLSNNVDNNDRKTNVRDDKLAISEYRQEEGRSSNNDDSRRDTESEQLNELFSIADRLDRRKNDYNKALANNDETAMRVALDAIARLNGYEYNGYHNSMSDFDVFEDGHRGNRPEHSLDEVAEAGWFSNEPNKEYGAKAYHSYIRMKNPYTIYGNSERAKAINDEIQKIVEARSAEKNGANRRGVIAALNKRKAELEEEYNSIEPFRRLQAEAKAVFDKYPEAKTYGEAFRIHATKHGYDGVKFVDTATDGKYGQDWYMPFKAGNNIKSADLVTRDDNDNVIPVEKRFSNSPSIRFSISPKQDADYKKAVESGDMETAQKMVDEAAKATGANFVSDVNGNLKTLFHGTNKFGFTTFRSKRPSGAMFTVDKSAVSANYGGDDNYAGKRRINQGYVESSATDTVLRNAKSVFGQPWRRATQEERNAVVKKMEVDAQRVMQRMDSLKEKSSNLPEEISNAVSWVEDIIYTAATGRENGNEGAEMQRLLSDGYEKFREYRDVVKEYYNDNYDNLDNPTKEYLRCIVGYELGDVAIDAGLSGAKAFAEEDILTVTGDNFLNTKELHDNVRQAHSVGSYQLYGDLGSNPLVVECNDKNWYDLDFNGMSSTDDIVEWANEHGYTSVEFRNIYDYGDKANVYAFFEPSSLKSADPVTYDDKGEVIPLSERFNPNKQDIRFSIANNGNNNTNQEHPLTERVESMRNSLDDILEELKNLSGKDDLSVLGRAHLKAIRKLLKEGEDVGTQVKEVGKSSVKQRMEKVRQLKQLVDALAKAIPNGSTVVKSHAANMIKKSIAIGAIPTKRNLEEFANDVYDFAQVVIDHSMSQSLDKLMSKSLTKKDGNDTTSLSSYSRAVHRAIQEFSPSKKKNSRTEEDVDKEIEKVKEQLVALNTAVANHELTFTDKTGVKPVEVKIDTDTLVKRYQTILPAKLAGLKMAKRMHQIEKLRKSVGSATASINERGITADEKRARKCDRREIRDDLISAEETMIRDWKAILAEGKANKDQQVYATEQAELNEQAFKAISYDLRGVTPRENAQKPSKFGKFWHELNGAGARSMEYMLNKLARLSPAGEGETFKLVFNLWSKARNQEIIRKKQITDTLTKKAKEIFKEKVKPGENPANAQSLIKNINELAGLEKQLSGAVMYREASNANYELEIGQLAMLYAWSKQDGAKEKLAATHVFMDEIPPRPHDGKTNLTADEMKEQKEWDRTYAHGVQLQDLLQHLPQEWKDWMDYLQSDFLPTYRQEYNPVFEARHGRPMPDIENYFPFRIAEENHATVSEQNLDNVNGVREMLNQAASAEIDRVSNCKSFDVVNQSAMSILSAHINEMEKVYNYNQLTEVLKSIITNNNIANRMNAIDKYTYKDFVKACQVVTGLGYNPTKDTNAFEYAVGRLTQSLARTKIGGKIWTALKQFESSIIYLDDIISDREFAKTYFNPAEMRHAWSFAQKNLPQLMERWQSKQLGDPMLNVSKFGSNSVTDKSRYRNQTARALAETFDNLGNLSNETSKLLMKPNAAVDFLTCSLGAYAKYKSEYKRCKALGMSDAVAHNNAVNAAQHIVNRSQQSQEAFYISPFQMSSSITSTFANVFRNSAYAYGRILRQSAKDIIKCGKNSQQFWDGIEESVRRECERNGITDPSIIQGEIIRRKTRAWYKLWTTPLATVLVTTGWEFCQYGAWELAQALNGDDGDDDETKAKAQKEIDAAAKVLEEAKKKLSEAQGEEAKKEAEENVKAAEKALESANNNYDKRMKAVHKQRMDMLKSGLLSAAINLMGSGVPYTQYVASAITAVVDADRVAGNFTQWEKFLSTFSPTSMMSGDVSSMASRFNRAIDVKDATGLTYAAADAILSLTGTVDLDVITNAVAGACALYQSNDNLSAANISYALSEIINAPTATKDAFIYAIRNGEDELETMGRICAYVLWQQRMGVKGELSRIPKKYFEKTNMMLPDMLDENIIDENGITITIKQNNILINTLLQMENTDRTLISLVQGTKEYQEASKYVDIQLALQENEWTWGFPTWFFTGQLFPSQQKQEEEQE